jgi:hypothetical protein
VVCSGESYGHFRNHSATALSGVDTSKGHNAGRRRTSRRKNLFREWNDSHPLNHRSRVRLFLEPMQNLEVLTHPGVPDTEIRSKDARLYIVASAM